MKRKSGTGKARKAILFELENVGLSGHRLAYEAYRAAFKAKNIELPPTLFSRFCLGNAAKKAVPQVLKWAGKERLSVERLVADVHAATKEAFSATGLKLDAALKRILEAAPARGIHLGAWSALEKPLCDQLAAALGIKEIGVQVYAHPNDERAAGGTDGWLKLARMLSIEPTYCVCLATSEPSTRAALAAHMRCVAIPTAFTAFADFGGADYLLASLGDLKVDTLLAMLEPSW